MLKPMPTFVHLAWLGVVQAGIILFGTLASAVSCKWWSVSEIPIPPGTAFLKHYGILGLVLPLVWISLVGRIAGRKGAADGVRWLAFFSGAGLAASLVILFVWVLIPPWLNVDTL